MAKKSKQTHMWLAHRKTGEKLDFFTYIIAKDWAGEDGTVTASAFEPRAKNQDKSMQLLAQSLNL